jgi:hypothetical protein
MDDTIQEITVTDAAVTQAKPDPWTRAADIRAQARGVLGGHSGGMSHRLLLTLSVITVLTAALALYAAVACLATAGELIFGEDALWVYALSNTLLAALGLIFVLPLAVSVGRLASLMAAPDGEVIHGMAVSVPTPSLTELFYPFTSLRAYGRTMAVGMEGLAFLLCGLGVPILAGRLVWLSIQTAGMAPWLRALIMAGVVLAGLGWGFGVLLLSGGRLGFGYLVFVHEELSLGDVNRCFRAHKRPLLPALCLRLRLAGLYALSFVAVCVPFVFHSLPLGLCCSAVFGRALTRQ